MKGDAKVLDYLNQSLKHELTAVNQYWLHYRLLEDWGYSKLAKHEREESIEEMRHADRLIARIIFLEGFPNMQSLNPLMIGQSIREVLECDLKSEYSARDLYTTAREVCRDARDYVSMQIFEDLLKDEESHIDMLETQLRLIEQIGVQNYGQLNATPANESEKDAGGDA